jgi:group I intron endonuclease
MGVIYIATNLQTGQQYVGQTRNFASRIKSHLKNTRYKSYFCHAIRDRGMSGFNFVQLEYPIDELNYWEKFWIAKLNTVYPNGYNLTHGGDQAIRFSDESRMKMRQSHLGKKLPEEQKKKIGLAGMGRHPSDETRKKLSDAKKGRIVSPETRAKSRQISLERWERKRKEKANG